MTTPLVLVPHSVGPERAEALRESLEAAVPAATVRATTTPAETAEHLPDADGYVGYHLDADARARATNLRWIHCLSSGVDHYDLDALAEEGVMLTNSSGIHAEPIAEQVLWYLLTFERKMHVGQRQQAEGHWERFEGGEIHGKTLGIVGVGAIGGRAAELASALGMDVLGLKRDTSEVPDGVDELFAPDGLHDLLPRVDYLLLACPLTDETAGLIGREELTLLGSDAVLVNIARGEVVDQDALVRALTYHTIGGAALDVFEEEPLPEDSPLWDLSNVVITPHMAGSNPNKLDRWTEILAENYRKLAAGETDLRNRLV
ncbi:D-2-hydroxyacid dehydrogenase [Haloarchaeobius sp. HME9146]|uniref:D-2-hydroxyacid dehydrogenase n=1 Tax=Haloarchaeobius sp. HME9146 TaxID=2978732 RepID=UPI0021C0E586|nr:D-2-hydroxyacid dehydrogenase [Haloarchaeobius sp. HME9146]MCT9097609.1 D-2-hydroxyacid dehydrogenase [Haloarchaeobius sp. HME9146]